MVYHTLTSQKGRQPTNDQIRQGNKAYVSCRHHPSVSEILRTATSRSPENPQQLRQTAEFGVSGAPTPVQNRMSYRRTLGPAVDAVGVHRDETAAHACRMLNTPAYSYQGDIALGASGVDQHVLDHETWHAANQRRVPMDNEVSRVRASDTTEETNASHFAATGGRVIPQPVEQASNRVPRLSLYSKKNFGGKEFRLSDDEKMAVRQDTNLVARHTFYGSKHFYAKPGLITAADTRLQGQKSAISLGREAVTLTIQAGQPAITGTLTSPRFSGDPRLQAILQGVRSEYIRWGSTGTSVETVQRALIDAGHPLPKYGPDGTAKGETKSAIKSFQRSVGLVGKEVDGVVGPTTMGHLDKAFGGGPKPAVPAKVLHRISASNVNTGTSGLSMTIVDDCGGAAKTIMMGAKSGFDTSAPQGGNNIKGLYRLGGVLYQTPTFTTSKQVRDHVIKKIMGKSTAAAALSEYWSKSAAERDQIDKDAEINQYAKVQTGESHSIVRGDSVGWNWHWGAVIMRSGSDNVTLENFAGSGSHAWDFQMYATSGAQSFHMEQKKRLQSDVATPEYGYKPITVRIKPA
ncbi:peptidoglycan-binding protein [Marinobacterium rhizophilum]|uniref:peptidoglycan-binding protein n=1 Tax=Marinobacterium rhizophilum TaxID=420402 RepID=UPI0003A93707|nr:peptidoglycan-binding protein [Marinobacterium rhizophilum]